MVNGTKSVDTLTGPVRFGTWWQLGVLLAFNSVVALLLATAAGDRYGENTLWLMFVHAQCIGFCINAATHGSARLAGRSYPQPRDLIPGVLLGAIAGSILGGMFKGTLDVSSAEGWRQLGANVFLGVVFGAAAGYAYFSTLRNVQSNHRLKQQEMQRVTAEKQLVETRLRLLQAQIEPHFLFNTLSNIHSLIETHPERASRMLEALTLLLRSSLKRTRDGETALGDELDLVRAYLEIQRERMGERLHFKIEAAESLYPLPFPPMLLQPLVENAVQHGIEPMVDGGMVAVRISLEGAKLRIEVSDSGRGLGQHPAGGGVGLRNVSERLASLFGSEAHLVLERRHPAGVSAVMEIPAPRTRNERSGA